MYNARMLFADAARAGAPKDEPEKVWAALGSYVDECLRMGKGLKVPKLGSFSAVKTSTRDAQPGLRRRVFHVANHFSRTYGVVPRKQGFDLIAPCLEFNASKLAYKAGTDKETAQLVLATLVRALGQAVAAGTPCRLLLDPVGNLVVNRRDVVFKFTGEGDEGMASGASGGQRSYPSAEALIQSWGMSGSGPASARDRERMLQRADSGGNGGGDFRSTGDSLDDEMAASAQPMTSPVGRLPASSSFSQGQAQAQGQGQAEEATAAARVSTAAMLGAMRAKASSVDPAFPGMAGSATAKVMDQTAPGTYLSEVTKGALPVGADLSSLGKGFKDALSGTAQDSVGSGLASVSSMASMTVLDRKDSLSNVSASASTSARVVAPGGSVGQAVLAKPPYRSMRAFQPGPETNASSAVVAEEFNNEGIAVFPRFLPVAVQEKLRQRSNTGTVAANMTNAFARVAQGLAAANAAALREQGDIDARQALSRSLFVARRVKEQRNQEELLAFLGRQAAEAEGRRHDERQAFLNGQATVGKGGKAYPVHADADAAFEKRLKDAFRGALDEQVGIREQAAVASRQMDLLRDDFVRQCVARDAQMDYQSEIDRKARARESLTESWALQEALAKQTKHMVGRLL